MKKLWALLLFIPCAGWSAYQPVTGSTVTVFPSQGTLFPVTVQQSTVGVVGTLTVTGSTVGVVGTLSVTGSTVGVVGSLGQAGTYTVTSGTGPWIVTGSTVGVVGSLNEYQTNPSTSQLRVLDLSGNAVNVGWAASVSSPVPVALVFTSSQPTIYEYQVNVSTVTGTVGQAGTYTMTPGTGTWPVSIATPYTVILTTAGANASTSTVVASFATFLANVSSSVVRLADQSGNGITSTGNALDINVKTGSITGTFNQVTVTTQTFGSPMIGTGTMDGFVGPGNTVQAARVDTSSAVWVNLEFSTFTGTLSTNGAAATTNRIGTLDAVAQNLMGNNGTAFTQGRDAALSVGINDGNLFVAPRVNMTNALYTAATSTFAVANSTSDFTWVCGNGKSTMTVVGCSVSCMQTTAGMVNLQVVRRSSIYTYSGGQISTMTATINDTNFATTNSTANYTTNLNLTNGAAVGTALDSVINGCNAIATAGPNDFYACPSSWKTYGQTLRGVNQCIGINLNGTTPFATGKVAVRWEWLDGNTP